jgi:hypothetical protein
MHLISRPLFVLQNVTKHLLQRKIFYTQMVEKMEHIFYVQQTFQ